MTADPLAFPPDCGALLSHILSPSPSPGPPYVHTFNYPRTEDDDLAIRAGLISLRQAREEFGFDPAGEPEDERDLIDRIDSLTAETGECWQCHKAMPVDAVSEWFCGEFCQERWHAARIGVADEPFIGFDETQPPVDRRTIEHLRTRLRPEVVTESDSTYTFSHPAVPGAVGYRYYFNGCPEGSEDPQEAWTLAQLHQAALVENAARDVCRAFDIPPELIGVGIPEADPDSRDDRMRRALEAHQNRGTGPQRSQRAPRRIDPARKWRG